MLTHANEGSGPLRKDRARLRQLARGLQHLLQRARLQAEGLKAELPLLPALGSTTTSTPPSTFRTPAGPILRGLVLISCNGASLGYGLRRAPKPVPARRCLRTSALPTFPEQKKSPPTTPTGHLRITETEMSKRAPSTTQLLVIAGFALSCFGILLFLWVTFGGPTPFRAKSYEIKVPFNEATQLAEQSDVRISGVNVGKVQSIDLAPERQAGAGDGRHRRQVRADARRRPGRSCAPRRCSARPTSNSPPGDATRPELADGGSVPDRQHRRIGPARRDLPHLRPRNPRRLPELDAGSARSRSTARARTSPTPSASSNRPSPNSTSSSATSTPSGSRSTSSSATAPSPSARCAAATGSSPS